ncbi:MAG: dihydroorotase, partial [Planctomycetaceae bacterium]|nr:dihydroorotase [Planctomycetaceae bacterium]
MSTLLIRGGRIIDPANERDGVGDLWIADGRIVAGYGGRADETIDAAGLIVCPGLIDPRVSLGEPGNEEDETIATGTAAALAGGFTSIGAMPGSQSAVDARAGAEFVKLQG